MNIEEKRILTYTIYVLKKRNRLGGVKIGREIFPGRKKTVSTNLFSLKIMELKEEKGPLFSVIIPSSLVKLATKRNVLKRRARTALGRLMKNIKPGTANVIFFKKGSENLNFRELKDGITIILKKSGLLN